MKKPQTLIVPVVMIAALAGVVWQRCHVESKRRAPVAPPVGAPGGPSTSRMDLDRTIATYEARLATDPGNATVAARLGEALMRQARAAIEQSRKRK